MQLETVKELKLVDCSYCEVKPMHIDAEELDLLFGLNSPESTEAMEAVWRWIDKEFSEPVERDSNVSGYVTTQILAELFKTNGFDGVQYHSLFNDGKNLALFDTNSAEIIEGSDKVCRATKIEVEYKQIYPHQFTKR